MLWSIRSWCQDMSNIIWFMLIELIYFIDFPKLNGKIVNHWIHQCENYFLIDNTLVAIVHLEGKALQWHIALIKGVNY